MSETTYKKYEEIYKPSDSIREFIYDTYTEFIRWRSMRDGVYKQFGGTTLLNYISDSRNKFWGYLPISDDADTQKFFFPETRNQIIQVLSKIANLKLKPSFEGVEGFDVLKSSVLKDLFEYWKRGANRKIQNFWQFLYAVVNGTVIVYTGYNSNVRNVSTITHYDPKTGEASYREDSIDDSDIVEEIVNLEDFYFPKMWEPDIQLQGACIWRTLMKFSDFKETYKGYKNVDKVMPGSAFSDTSIFADFLSYDVRGGEFVEVIKKFDVYGDKYAIIANGVLMNPIVVKGVETVGPLPWNHKMLPFSKTVFEPTDAKWFYGTSLPQKVKDPQEALNQMWELMLDREKKSVAAPIITTDPSMELGLQFKAGHIYQVNADVNQYKELQIGPTSGSTWNALTSLQGIINKTGSGGSGPVLPTVQPRSATEKRNEAAAVRESAGLYFLFYQDLLEQKVWLVLKNMIQFYTASKVEEIIGDRKFNKVIALTKVQLAGGGIGNREVRITSSPSKPAKLREESYMRSLMSKEHVEIIEVTPEGLNKLRFDLKIAFEQESSPEEERALYLDYIVTLWKLFGQSGLLSQKKSLFRLTEKFGENISDVVEDNVLQMYEDDRFGTKVEGELTPGSLPEVNNFNQSMRGMENGANGPLGKVGGIMGTYGQ